jgi:hypothetical protein
MNRLLRLAGFFYLFIHFNHPGALPELGLLIVTLESALLQHCFHVLS